VTPIDLGVGALLTLVPISIFAGIGMLLAFRHTSDQAAVRRLKGLVTAHLLEFRLFMDEPRLILRAQRDLILANLRFIRLMLRPVLILTVPMALLLVEMDAFYGRAPLVPGEAAIVTTQSKTDPAGLPLVLKAPPGIAVETSGVRVPAEHQVSWRIRPLLAIAGSLELSSGGNTIRKTISAGSGIHYLSERRASLAGFFLHPTEWPITHGAIDWIEVRYPGASILGFHWLLWFFVISGITALLLRRKFRTAF